MSVWESCFAMGCVAAYAVLSPQSTTVPHRRVVAVSLLRYLIVIYLCAIAAQALAYVCDAYTSVTPPPGVHWAAYYLDPTAGPKTLFGSILALPVVLALTRPTPPLLRGLSEELGVWTPVLFVILTGARLGCFLTGCCYGVVHDWGVTFPVGSVVYHRHLSAGLIATGQASLPVVPTQLLELAVCVAIAWWSYRAVQLRRQRVFGWAVIAYSASRFALEFLRADPDRNVAYGLSTSQWIALAVVVASGLMVMIRSSISLYSAEALVSDHPVVSRRIRST